MITYLNERKGLLAAFIVTAAAALRLAFIGNSAYFIDELHAIRFSAGSFAAAMKLLAETPGTAPLDYGLVNVLQRVSASEASMRLPYALFGTISVWLVYVLGARWFGRGRGLAAAGLAALSTAHIFYSQSIRCYSLSVLLLLLAVDAYDRFFRLNERRAWPGFVVVCVLSVFNQFFMLMPVSVLLCGGFFAWMTAADSEQKKTRIQTVVAAGIAVAAVVLLNWNLIFHPKSLGVIRDTPKIFVLVFQTIVVFVKYASIGYVVPGIILLLLLITGFFHLLFRKTKYFPLVAALIFLPIPVIILQEMRMKSGVHLRHLLYALPFYMLVAANGIESLAGGLARLSPRGKISRHFRTDFTGKQQWELVVCAVLLLLLIPSLKLYYGQPYRFNGGEVDLRLDMRTPAEKIARLTSRNDVLVSSGIAQGPWRYSIDFYLGRMGRKRIWTPVRDLNNIDEKQLKKGRVFFVFFDFPYKYTRDFTRASKQFKAVKLNGFITLLEPSEPVTRKNELVERASEFVWLTMPPSDFGLFSSVYSDMGVLESMKGKWESADKFHERAVSVAEGSVLNVLFDEIEAREEYGITLLQSGDTYNALSQLKAAERILPQKVSLALSEQLDYRPERLYSYLARASLATGSPEGARQYENKAREYERMRKKIVQYINHRRAID